MVSQKEHKVHHDPLYVKRSRNRQSCQKVNMGKIRDFYISCQHPGSSSKFSQLSVEEERVQGAGGEQENKKETEEGRSRAVEIDLATWH